jgi:IclR family acetate operon transcriptional repressor
MSADNGRLIQSVERALSILDLFGKDSPPQLSLKAISAATGLHTSTAFHLLSTMVHCGYLAQDAGTRRYMLGPALLRLQPVPIDEFGLLRIGRPFVEQLVTQTREESYLGILRGWRVLSLVVLPSPQAVRVARPDNLPPALHATASGKLFLAYRTDDLVSRYLEEVPLTALTPATLVDPAALHQELEAIRAAGVAYDREEQVTGISCIAAPVFGDTGEMRASLSIAYPTFRADPEKVARWTVEVVRGAQALSARLGHTLRYVAAAKPLEA